MANQVTKLTTPNEDLTDEIMRIIKCEAKRCWLLQIKPTIHTYKDLVNDGIIIYYKAHKAYQKHDRSFNFESYLWKTLKNEFGRKARHCRWEVKSAELGDLAPWHVDSLKSSDIMRMTELIRGLSVMAQIYVETLLDPSPALRKLIVDNPTRKVTIVREYLGLNKKREWILRNEIKKAFVTT